MYVDGSNNGVTSDQWNPDDAGTSLKIGTNATAALNFFDGQIDEIRYYNRALSASEVTELYNLGR